MKRVFAFLLAATMLFALPACGKKEEEQPAALDVTTAAEQFLEAYFTRNRIAQFPYYCYDARAEWEDQAIKDNGSAEEFFAIAQKQADAKGLDVHVDSFDSYFTAYHEVDKQYKRDAYGEYTISFKAVSNEKMEAQEAADFVAKIIATKDDKYVNQDVVASITEVYTITVRVSVDGEKKDLEENYLVHMAYCNDKWQVVSHSA